MCLCGQSQRRNDLPTGWVRRTFHVEPGPRCSAGRHEPTIADYSRPRQVDPEHSVAELMRLLELRQALASQFSGGPADWRRRCCSLHCTSFLFVFGSSVLVSEALLVLRLLGQCRHESNIEHQAIFVLQCQGGWFGT